MCYELTGSDGVLSSGHDDGEVQNVVPLGNPLMDTVVELHDVNDDVITSGSGQIWIGVYMSVSVLVCRPMI